MTRFLSIDPGKSKCGLVIADSKDKKIIVARVIKSELLIENIKNLIKEYQQFRVILGNGTTSKQYIKKLNFLNRDLILAEEKNTTIRAKERYFDLFPLKGFRRILPREIYLINLNLDAIAALIILEDYCNCKFDLISNVETKTWQK